MIDEDTIQKVKETFKNLAKKLFTDFKTLFIHDISNFTPMGLWYGGRFVGIMGAV